MCDTCKPNFVLDYTYKNCSRKYLSVAVFLSIKCILIDYLTTLVSVSACATVCPQIVCRTITFAILYRFSPNFACRSKIWLFQMLLFLGQTGSSLPILEVCKIRFWQFRDCSGHIFPRIVTKTRTEYQQNQTWRQLQLPRFSINFVRFGAAFDRPEFDRTQQCLFGG